MRGTEIGLERLRIQTSSDICTHIVRSKAKLSTLDTLFSTTTMRSKQWSSILVAAYAVSTTSPFVQGQEPVVLSEACTDLVAGDSPPVGIGQVCADMVGSNLEVVITVSDENCALTEAHICNVPTEGFRSSEGVRNHPFAIDRNECKYGASFIN